MSAKPKLSAEAKRMLADEDRSLFYALLKREKIPLPVSEFRFDPTRRWRADYAWPDHKVILEVEGGVWTNGRHLRGAGFLADVSKYNRAAILGYRLLRCTPNGLHDLETITMLQHALSPASPRIPGR